MTVHFLGAGKRLEDPDLPRLGARMRCGEDEVHAFMDVESRGKGFDSQGRVIMLFEPHVLYRELAAGKTRQKAVQLGIAYPNWGQRKYPKDSYPNFLLACELDETAAVRSCSWGLGQVMGFNCVAAGYQTGQDMVAAFSNDEDYQLEAAVNFIISKGLDDELREHRWAAFARGYNGSQYAKHGYHTRLEAAYYRWSRIKDTPWTPQSAGRDCPCPCLEAA